MTDYVFQHLDDAAVKAIQETAVSPPAPVITKEILMSWEADLAAHMALADAATDPEVKKEHDDAISVIVAALNQENGQESENVSQESPSVTSPATP